MPTTVSPFALTTLDAVKLFAGIEGTDDDEFLRQLINAISAKIEKAVGRRFLAREYRDRYDGVMQRQLVLRNFPVQHVVRVSYGAAGGLTVRNDGLGMIRATAGVFVDPESADGGRVLLDAIATDGTQYRSSLDVADYASTSSLVDYINGLGGWAATLQTNWPTADLLPAAMNNAIAQAVSLMYPDCDLDSYAVNERAGLITFDTRTGLGWNSGVYSGRAGTRFGAGRQAITVQYRAGYETIPADVEAYARELVRDAFYGAEGDGTVKSETTGPYSVAYADAVTSNPSAIRSRLAFYVNKQIGGGG